MAKTDNTKSETEKLDDEARAARQAQLDAEETARRAALTDEQRAAEDAKKEADAANAKALDAKAREEAEGSDEPTPIAAVKAASAAADPVLDAGAHHAQTFSNMPENPQPAPGIDPDHQPNVKLVLNDSDHPDPNKPLVTYVHDVMVGDYLRAGWRRPVAE